MPVKCVFQSSCFPEHSGLILVGKREASQIQQESLIFLYCLLKKRNYHNFLVPVSNIPLILWLSRYDCALLYTHLEGLHQVADLLIINPGSPTLPRNQSLRLGTIGILDISSDSVNASIYQLTEDGLEIQQSTSSNNLTLSLDSIS